MKTTYLHKLTNLTAISGNEIGKLSLLNSVYKDLEYLHKHTNIDISSLFEEFDQNLDFYRIDNFESKLGEDISNSINFKNLIFKSLTIDPNDYYSTRTYELLRSARGAIIYVQLIHNIRLSNKLASTMLGIFKRHNKKLDSILENNQFSKQNLINLRINFPELSIFIEPCIKFFEIELKTHFPPSFGQVTNIRIIDQPQKVFKPNLNNVSEIVNTNTNENSNAQNNNTNPAKNQNWTDDLLKWKLQPYNLSPRHVSGANTYRLMHPQESKVFISIVVKEFLETKQDYLLAIVIIFLLGVSVRRFHFVSINKDLDKHYWLDLDHGCVCYNRNLLINNDSEMLDKDVIKVPLPREVVLRLIETLNLYPKAKTLKDLFPVNQLKLVVNFIKNNSPTSKLCSISRLEISYGQYLFEFCGDDVYSALIAADFSITDKSVFSYFTAKSNVINNICEKSFKNMGFSGKLFKNLTVDVGSPVTLNVDQAIAKIKQLLNEANNAILTLNSKTHVNLEYVWNVQEKISTAVLIVCIYFLGLRDSASGYFAAHQLDLKNKLVIITDKKVTEYLTWRLIPIPEFLCEWLYFYFISLKIISKRIRNFNLDYAKKIYELSEMKGIAELPTFFIYSKKRKIFNPLSSARLRLVVPELFKTNSGRHDLDFLLRESLGSEYINIFMSHALTGQEAFGDRSCLSPEFAFKIIRREIDLLAKKLELPLPANINAPKGKFIKSSESTHFFRTILASKRDLNKAHSSYQLCPFHEYSLLYNRYFLKISDRWKSAPIKCDLSDIVFGLIIFDGVTDYDQLMFCLFELIFGKIYVIKGVEFAVDILKENIGIRRTYISAETFLIANNYSEQFLSLEPLEKCILEKQASDSFGKHISLLHLPYFNRKPTLRDFIFAAEAAKSLLLPSVLRAWGKWHFVGRTRRIESIAREVTGRPELPIEMKSFNKTSTKINTDYKILEILKKFENTKSKNDLKREISNILSSLPLAEDRFLAAFVNHLASNYVEIKSISTIVDHYHTARNLVSLIPSDVFERKEIDTVTLIMRMENFIKNKHQKTTCQYILEMLKNNKKLIVDTQKIKPYVEYLSSSDQKNIEILLNNTRSGSVHNNNQLSAMLELLLNSATRGDETRKIKLKNTYFKNQIFIINILGSKTDNSKRLIVSEVNLWPSLLKIIEKFNTLIGKNSDSYLFSDIADNSLKNSEEIYKKVCKSISQATGSYFARPHNYRNAYISNSISRACTLNAQSEFPAHQLRLHITTSSIQLGHGDEKTSIDEYAIYLDKNYREWMDYENSRLKPNGKFYGSIIKKNPDRLGREIKNIESRLKVAINKILPKTKLKCIDVMSEFTTSELTPQEINKNYPDSDYIKFAQYIILQAKGIEHQEAVYIVEINFDSFEFYYNGLNSLLFGLTGASAFKWTIGKGKKYKKLVTNILKKNNLLLLQQNLSAIQFNTILIAVMSHIIPEDLSQSWSCSKQNLQFIQENKLIERIHWAGFESILFLPKTHLSEKNIYQSMGFSSIEFFSSSKSFYKLSFFPKGTKYAARPTQLGSAMIQINSILLTIISYNLGKH